jgi:exopolyphosphatase/guanosine-5'-triphosphate,3'-diphosphate pyrophosphatase
VILKNNLIAAIDVGSHAIRMKIGEIDEEGNFKELESLRKTAVLGHDTFNDGKISYESVDTVCNILKMFKKCMKDYRITDYKAMATSAIREAENKDYIIDQIKLKTGLDIKVIDNAREQYLTHKAIKRKIDNFDSLIEKGVVMVVIGAGSIQITLYKNSQLISSQNVKLGALRVKEVLGDLERESFSYYKILEEYIRVNIESIDFFKRSNDYNHFIAVGGEITTISKLINEEHIEQDIIYINRKQFEILYKEFLHKSTEEILEYNIERERAEIIIPSMMLFKKFLDKSRTDKILVPNITLSDGIIMDIYEEKYNLDKEEMSLKDIFTCVKNIAKKYDYNKDHSLDVEKNAKIIFDNCKDIHGLESERHLLRIAAILHDIGKYISVYNTHILSYTIIKSIEIFGISNEQLEIIANVARYNSVETPSIRDINFGKLSNKNKVIVGKLAAILRLANALDKSHNQKIEIISVKRRNKQLIIYGKSSANTMLEMWTFKKKAEFFKEVFGITPILIIKKEI